MNQASETMAPISESPVFCNKCSKREKRGNGAAKIIGEAMLKFFQDTQRYSGL